MTNPTPEQLAEWKRKRATDYAEKNRVKYGRDFKQAVDCVEAGIDAALELGFVRGALTAMQELKSGGMVDIRAMKEFDEALEHARSEMARLMGEGINV
jgi:hypothetical protein